MLSTLRCWLTPALAIVGAAFLPAALRADSPRTDDFKDKAVASEKRHDWLEACRLYDKALRKDRTQPDLREGYLRCLRHVYLARRQADRTYRQTVAKLSGSQALEVYDQVLVALMTAYVDRSKTDVGLLFEQGVQELRFALDEDAFVNDHLAGSRPQALARFRARLDDWMGKKVLTRTEAHEEVLAVIQAAKAAGLDVKATFAAAVGLEFASGACNALDEYTLFLTPGYYSDIQTALQGKQVGVGVDLGFTPDMKIEIARLYPKSPAGEAGLYEHDRVLRIANETAENLSPEMAAERLRGDSGTMVEIEVQTMGEMTSRVVKVQRRAVVVPSVMEPRLLALQTPEETIPVGLIQINYFSESTVQDVKEALAQLQTAGVKGLILDLRGNPGGSFKAGVQVAELFLNEGVVVYAESPRDEFNHSYKVEAKNPVTLPVVILVDRDTASAAEVVAGALKDRRPGNTLLVGQTTFGKGSIQGDIVLDKAPLDKTPGCIHLTVAKLFSPGKHLPYTGRGVLPDVPVDQEGDATTAAGIQALVQLIRPPAMMMH